MVGAGVDEQEEVVADELHPVHGLLDRHPLRFELLRADHDRGVVGFVLVAGHDGDLPCRDGTDDIQRGRLHVDSGELSAPLLELRAPRVVARIDALVLRATQLFAQLVDRHVQRRELVAVGGLGPDDRTLARERELDRVVLHSAVVVGAMGHFDVDTLRARSEVLYAGGLVFDD